MLFRKPRVPVTIGPPAHPAGVSPAVALPQPVDIGPLLSGQFLDLMPIPMGIVQVGEDGITFAAVNRVFREAGLGSTASASPLIQLLGARIVNFLSSSEDRSDFAWQFGQSIDARHYRVTFARRKGAPVKNRCLVSLIDETGAQRTETSLRREMLTDSLTGLPNRGGFGDELEATITVESRASYAVMIVNIDRFSRVNACMGSLSGDELLISVARRIKGALRARDMLARIGGDEFGVLLTTEAGEIDAMHVATRICSALATPFRLSDFEIKVDCSIGISLGSEDVADAEDMIRHAQFAVKRAKKTGDVEFYSHSNFDIVRTQFGIETQLRRAVENGEMRLCFQPIHDLATGRIASFEALARWAPEGRELSPVDFIPVAEESGLIVPLGRWAMDSAAQTIAAWDRRAGGDCGARLAVNLSAIQLQRDQIAPMVRNALTAHGVDGRRLTLELTESAIVSDPDRISATLQALKELGSTIAMDDFGTGYSNLAYLQRLPIDVLKIDRSFVTEMLADRDKLAIIRAILSLAAALGMRTTAEGIETLELSQTLAALGCTYGQGYYYSRPLEAEDAYQLLVARSV